MRIDPDIQRTLDQLPPGSWSLRPAKKSTVVVVYGQFAGRLRHDGRSQDNNRSRINLLVSIRRLSRRG